MRKLVSSPKNKLFFVLMFVSVIFASGLLAGCGGSSAPQDRPLYSGSDAIAMSFPPSNALSQYQGSDFTLAIRLLNDGTANISKDNPGHVTASFDSSVLDIVQVASSSTDVTQPPIQNLQGQSTGGGLIQQAAQAITGGASPVTSSTDALPGSAVVLFTANGRALYQPVGDLRFVEFTFHARNLSVNRQHASTPVTFQACYPYTTTFITTTCVDRDILSTASAPVCTPQALTASPQGAPIAVKSVTPRYTRVGDVVEARYEIGIENLKDGIVIWPGEGAQSAAVCNLEELKRLEYGLVNVSGWISGKKLSCGTNGDGLAHFNRRTASIVCRLDNSGASGAFARGANYEAPLILQLHYFYIDTMTAQIEVNR